MKILSLIFFLLITPYIFSQDILNLYQKNFPPEYYNEEQNKRFLLVNLQKLVSIRPDIIYYFSEVLNSFSNNHDTTSFRNGMRYISSLSSYIEFERTLWAKSQIKKITALRLDPSLKQKEIDLFSSIANDTIKPSFAPASPFAVDSNKIFFFSLIYYTGNPSLEYRASTDYKIKVYEAEKYIIDYYKNISNPQKISKDINITDQSLEGLLKYWYLFNTDDGTEERNVYAYKIAADFLEQEYSFGSSFNQFVLAVGYGSNNTPRISYLIDEKPIYTSVAHENSFLVNQISIDFAYKYQFKSVRSIFSYLNFDLSFQAFGSSQNIKQNINRTFTYRTVVNKEITDYTDQITSDGADVKMNRLTTIMLEPSVPIFFPYKNISLELGFKAGMNIINYTLDYSYHYKRTAVRTVANGSQTTFLWSEGDLHPPVETNTRTQWIIRPVVNLIIDVLSNVSVRAVVSPDLSKVLLGYSF